MYYMSLLLKSVNILILLLFLLMFVAARDARWWLLIVREEHSSITKLETTRAIIAKPSTTLDQEVAKKKKEPRISYKGYCEKKDCVKTIIAKPSTTLDEEVTKTIGCDKKENKKEPLMRKRVVKKESRISNEEYCEKKDCANSDDQYPKKTVAVDKNGSTTHNRGILKEKGGVGCKISRTVREEECKMKKNMKVQKNGRVVVVMDHCKKMQCWVMLKRLMTGRDSWVFKQPFMGLEILDNKDYSFHASSISKKPTCLKDIESKLNKFLYTNLDEFAEDERVVLSYGFLHPPRNDIYKIARRVSNDFELRWKSLKEKWMKDLKTFQQKDRKYFMIFQVYFVQSEILLLLCTSHL